ncbi:Glycosyl hydrolases family 32 N-terminal domain-containing protein [Fontibacillus panacisegetis]|uniref:Glycosyl hydrolases family 32 N-terminal domain-containing protein n=1 Tax=Fontibacillus panacisegetis TaxID=670482 RepID=A0A1G7NBJ0_9BACL|nr:Glycosyl hydrolases family 32 N-terminal domain-containing protein [Fontibacillus panacisegetis]
MNWRDLPVALVPEKDKLAPDGIWSGSAAYDADGLPVLFFTAGNDSASPNQSVALARSTYSQDRDADLADGEEETLLYYDLNQSMLLADRTKTTLHSGEKCGGIQGGKLELLEENLKLHIYLDRSMVEAYANGLKSLTTRVYPSRLDATGLQIWGDGEIHRNMGYAVNLVVRSA